MAGIYFLVKIRADQDRFLKVSITICMFIYTGRALAVEQGCCRLGDTSPRPTARAGSSVMENERQTVLGERGISSPPLAFLAFHFAAQAAVSWAGRWFPKNPCITLLGQCQTCRTLGKQRLAAVFRHHRHMTWSSCSVFCAGSRRNATARWCDLEIFRNNSAWQYHSHNLQEYLYSFLQIPVTGSLSQTISNGFPQRKHPAIRYFLSKACLLA